MLPASAYLLVLVTKMSFVFETVAAGPDPENNLTKIRRIRQAQQDPPNDIEDVPMETIQSTQSVMSSHDVSEHEPPNMFQEFINLDSEEDDVSEHEPLNMFQDSEEDDVSEDDVYHKRWRTLNKTERIQKHKEVEVEMFDDTSNIIIQKKKYDDEYEKVFKYFEKKRLKVLKHLHHDFERFPRKHWPRLIDIHNSSIKLLLRLWRNAHTDYERKLETLRMNVSKIYEKESGEKLNILPGKLYFQPIFNLWHSNIPEDILVTDVEMWEDVAKAAAEAAAEEEKARIAAEKAASEAAEEEEEARIAAEKAAAEAAAVDPQSYYTS